MALKLRGFLGGTFDPIHNGHLAIMTGLTKCIENFSLSLLPNYTSFKKKPIASAEQRLHMLQLALQDYPAIHIETHELEKPSISYTIDTVQWLRKKYPKDSLCFILGSDAWVDLPHWKNSADILQFVHLIVVKREGNAEDALVSQDTLETLYTSTHGRILQLPFSIPNISSSQLRTQILHKEENLALPAPVLQYIQSQNLYLSA